MSTSLQGPPSLSGLNSNSNSNHAPSSSTNNNNNNNPSSTLSPSSLSAPSITNPHSHSHPVSFSVESRVAPSRLHLLERLMVSSQRIETQVGFSSSTAYNNDNSLSSINRDSYSLEPPTAPSPT